MASFFLLLKGSHGVAIADTIQDSRLWLPRKGDGVTEAPALGAASLTGGSDRKKDSPAYSAGSKAFIKTQNRYSLSCAS